MAREALSAGIDGERLHVPSARVDAHVQSCEACARWLADVKDLAQLTGPRRLHTGPDLSARIVAAADAVPTEPGFEPAFPTVLRVARYVLAIVGLLQLGVATAQVFGADFGMVAADAHGAMTGAHLLNESTAWSLALGCGMLIAAVWPRTAPGMAAVLGVFTVVLVGYVIGDFADGQVTLARIASHLPAAVGLVLILLISLDGAIARRRAARAHSTHDIVLPAGAKWGRRRGHVRPIDHSAA